MVGTVVHVRVRVSVSVRVRFLKTLAIPTRVLKSSFAEISLGEAMALILVVSDEEMIFRSSQIYCWHPDSWPLRSRGRFGFQVILHGVIENRD